MAHRPYKLETRAVWTGDISPALQLRLMRCFSESFAQEKTDRYFQWKFKENPFGDSLHVYTEVDGQIVASRVFWRMDVAGQTAYQCVDTAVLKSFRGEGLFTLTLNLAKQVLGNDLIYNLPNSQSGPLYLREGWEVISNSGKIRLANWLTLEQTPHIDWGIPALSWRFANNPNSTYFQHRRGGNTYIFAQRRGYFYVLLGKTPHLTNLRDRTPRMFFSYDNSAGGIVVKKSLPLMYRANRPTPQIGRFLLDMA